MQNDAATDPLFLSIQSGSERGQKSNAVISEENRGLRLQGSSCPEAALGSRARVGRTLPGQRRGSGREPSPPGLASNQNTASSAQRDQHLEGLTLRTGPGFWATPGTLPLQPGHGIKVRGLKCQGLEPARWPAEARCVAVGEAGPWCWACFCSLLEHTHAPRGVVCSQLFLAPPSW